ncbi:hypothetical protein DSO57_1012871 [Entomophthora muscae]|uniref:Uncharacterized protein n=1 Tax=Entomophthora muscae TaxID=34485 RepID=A0ACC2TT37_9FUNG|nr:hypothetical protein DSO57_1012871 [Entomophthora muscae]
MLFWLTQLLPYFVFAVYQFSLRSPGLPAPPPTVFCPPGALFGQVHFTEYPLKPKYKDHTPERIPKLYPLACIQSAIRYNRQGLWIFSTPKFFRGKFNYFPAYNLSMELPVTPKPMPASSSNLPTNHTGKLFGIVYITLTGVIDTNPGCWPVVLAQVTPENNGLAAQDWIPDKQDGLLETLNQYGVIPVIVDRPSKKGLAAQHNGPKSKGNPDNCLQTWTPGHLIPSHVVTPKPLLKMCSLRSKSYPSLRFLNVT